MDSHSVPVQRKLEVRKCFKLTLMASFTKHLSTHVYFHMDRAGSQRKTGTGSGFSGFVQEAPPISNNGKSRNKENNSQHPGGRSNHLQRDYYPGEREFSARSRIPDTQSSMMGREHSRPDYDDFDIFCQSPTMLSPELSARDKNRRKIWRRSKDNFELKAGDIFKPSSYLTSRFSETTLDHDIKRTQQQLLGQYVHKRKGDVRPPRRFSSTAAGDERQEDSTVQKVRDCFIIPSHFISRFMPFYHESSLSLPSQALSMMKITDPKICIIFDFGENTSFGSQDLPSPTTALDPPPKDWLMIQLSRQQKQLGWIQETLTASEGMLLMNVEQHSQFPFITYLVLNTNHSDPRRLVSELENNYLPSTCQDQLHHIAGYEEVATIARPPIDMLPKAPTTSKTGYIISAFRVFPGEDREKLERSWLMWTGARLIYKRLPRLLGLRRITFHKKICPERGITYVLLCECAALMERVTEACVFVDQLRARCCGYTALYRVVDIF
ncbi:uncharacterized protein LOC143225589 isoform X1 [Tachypleus tridentatus]|uniref:uncharacterized protein LOC143225589 isoform X1 n=1 Tax=Tachypleus tridentatus TaxID=6853 RepID=UPI003FD141B2